MPNNGAGNPNAPPLQGRWVPTVCTMCYNSCSIRVLVQDGVARAIEGLPGAPPNYGRMCAKGKSVISELHNPNRVTRPLRRTNPEKGLDVDPKWEEISWEEAMDIVVTTLRDVVEQYPGGVSVTSFDISGVTLVVQAFLTACGGGRVSLTVPTSQYLFCGRAVHPPSHMMNGSADRQPDLNYCKYLLVLGGGFGTGTGTHAIHMARDLANARVERGMKMVVVDPCRTSSGARADEWVPILPGTDAALCLAVINLLINELELYDREFLCRYTNAPYLVRADGHYLRDSASLKPLVLTRSSGSLATYDSVDDDDIALEGEVKVGTQMGRTAFSLLREHVRRYTLDYASKVTTVPASTIQRIASDFGNAASIGSRVTIDGTEVPLRPACAIWYRGLGQHQHGMHHAWAAAMLNMVVGAVSVPGGCCDTGAAGPWGLPTEGVDGLLKPTGRTHGTGGVPPKTARFDPNDPSLEGMFPVVYGTSVIGGLTLQDQERFGIDYPLKFWIHARGNPMKTAGNPTQTAEILKRISFQLSFVQQLDETSQFADLILPDAHYLERLVAFARNPFDSFHDSPAPGDSESTFGIQQPTVSAPGGAKSWVEVIWDIAHLVGLKGDFYSALNSGLGLDGQHRLKREEEYTYKDFIDVWMRSWSGENRGLDYYSESGYAVAHGGRGIQHDYPRVFHRGRIPLYIEHWLTAGESVRDVLAETGMQWGDLSDYEPLVNYRPCWASEEGGKEFPLYLVSPKVGFLTLSNSIMKNPHLQGIAWANGEIFNLGVHPNTAANLGLEEGDIVEVEAPNGKTSIAVIRLTWDVHPRVLTAPGNVGRVLSSDGKSEGNGIHLNSFLDYRLERIDMVSAALDACAKVRIRKADASNSLLKTLKARLRFPS